MTRTISLRELQSHFDVAPGDESIIEDAGQPVARITPAPVVPEANRDRELGFFKGQIWIAPDFDAPDPEFEDLFYNGPIFPESDAESSR